MHPSIPRSLMKHNMNMYEKRICFLKIILHQYTNDPPPLEERKKGVLAYQPQLIAANRFVQVKSIAGLTLGL